MCDSKQVNDSYTRPRPSWVNYLLAQRNAMARAVYVWGRTAMTPHECALRVLEEAAELCQASGGSRYVAHKIVDMVYDKPVGEVEDELFGVLSALMIVHEVHGKRMDDTFGAGTERFARKDPEVMRMKQRVKADLGVSMRIDYSV